MSNSAREESVPEALSAHEYPLYKVFSSEFEFHIPEYQRPYRWREEQALQLLDDLEESLTREVDEPYFLGSLVLVRRGPRRFDVIDGQQRLTTLSLLFAVLRDLATDPSDARELGELVLEPGNGLRRIPSKPRLTLRDLDAAFFATYVQTPGLIERLAGLSDDAASNEPQRAIRDNAKALRKRLVEWDGQRRNDLASLMMTRTYLVVVSTPDLNSAYRIFSVMNARGLDLAPADIFKSEVIGALPAESPYSQRWVDAEEALGSDDFTEVFRDIRTVVNGERARLELLREFPEQVLNGYLDRGAAAEFVDNLLLPYAKAYEHTMTCSISARPEWRPVNDWLRRLALIDNKDWRPAVLWALVEHGEDAGFLASFLRQLERLAAMFLLRGEYSTPRVGRYLDLLKELKGGEGIQSPSLRLTAEEKAAARAALEGEVYLMQAKRARYVILRLDELLGQQPGVTYEHSIISIEHVLPQNPAVDSEWVSTFTVEERARWTHRLGNLVLLNRRKNSQASNFDFAAKKARYFTTSTGVPPFPITVQVLAHEEWTPAVVAQRQTELVGVLSKEWELD